MGHHVVFVMRMVTTTLGFFSCLPLGRVEHFGRLKKTPLVLSDFELGPLPKAIRLPKYLVTYVYI